MAKTISDNERLLAAISYLWILFIFPFVLGHGKPFVYKHAKQGLALFLLEMVLSIISWVPFIGWAIGLAGWLFVVIVAMLGVANALSGKEYEIPLIGKYLQAKK